MEGRLGRAWKERVTRTDWEDKTRTPSTNGNQQRGAPGRGRTDIRTCGWGRGEGIQARYIPTPEDLHLREFYGDWVHANPGTHLDSRIGDNAAWQAWWRDLAFMPSRRYDAPSRKVGRRFVEALGG